MARTTDQAKIARKLCFGLLRRCQKAQDLVEYALLAGFVAVAAGAAVPYAVAAPIKKIYEAALNLLIASGG